MSIDTPLPIGKLKKAAQQVDTPFYYYSASLLSSRLSSLKAVLPKKWGCYFAVKANPNIEILKLLTADGGMLETVSAGEMKAALKAGCKPWQMALSGPVKSRREIKMLEKNQLFAIHAESADELAELERLGKPQRVALRINPDFKVSSKGSTPMIGGREKFGFSLQQADKVLSSRHNFKNIEVIGFHIYLGTQVQPAAWLRSATLFFDCINKLSAKHDFKPKYLNFGGGFAIPYTSSQKPINLAKLKLGLKKLSQRIDKIDRFKDASFFIEPGRWVAGPAGVYVMTVMAVKKIRGRHYAITDGGVHQALFPFRVSKEFPVRLLNRSGTGTTRYTIGGVLCTTLDQSDLRVSLPPLKRGDLLGIYNSGAYGYSASMQHFLSHPLPAEVMEQHGKLLMIRKPSEEKHLFIDQTREEI